MFKKLLGFTMIELLIVIAVLGILAVAVLSAINPIEQINRGRDTGSRSDAEQLISAVDRFYATKGYYPWNKSAFDTIVAQEWLTIDTISAWTDNATTPVNVLDKLSGTVGGSAELKSSFVERIVGSQYNFLQVYNKGTAGGSTYVCFTGKSQAFQTEAQDRCDGKTGSIPSDIDVTTKALICGDCGGASCAGVGGKFMTCLP